MNSRLKRSFLLAAANLPVAASAQTVPLTQDTCIVTSPATGSNYGSAATLNVVASNYNVAYGTARLR